MKYIDLFYITTYFILKKLGKDEDGAKWSAMLHVSMLTLVTFTIIIFTLSVLNIFPIVPDGLKAEKALAVGLSLVLARIYYLRYYKKKANITQEQKYIDYRNKNFKKSVIVFLVLHMAIAVIVVFLAIANKQMHG